MEDTSTTTDPTAPGASPAAPGTGRRRWPKIAAGAAVGALAIGATAALAPSAQAIVHGTAADDGEYPWMVALTEPDGEQFCGGAVLAADLVVTAAHCVVGEEPGRLQVVAGAVRLGDARAQRREVAVIEVHRDPDANDIARLRLAEPFALGSWVQAIPIVDPDAQASLVDHGSPVVVTGWGARSEDDESTPETLQETELFVLGDERCERLDEWLDADTMVCANHPAGNDSCYGDSGGPLVAFDPDRGRHFLLGVVSYGITECGDTAGVYMEAPAFAEFLTTGADVADPDDDPGGAWGDDDWDDDDWGDDWWSDDEWADDPWGDWIDEWNDDRDDDDPDDGACWIEE